MYFHGIVRAAIAGADAKKYEGDRKTIIMPVYPLNYKAKNTVQLVFSGLAYPVEKIPKGAVLYVAGRILPRYEERDGNKFYGISLYVNEVKQLTGYSTQAEGDENGENEEIPF